VSSAPPLPEAFGNYALGDFVEVVSPQAISWLPQTVGWWWLGAALLAVFARYSWRRLRYWYRNRYRREAAARLQKLGDTADKSALVAELNRLLKLTALAAFSREQVASLSGKEWVDFLNGQCPTPPFSGEQGQLLAVDAYRTDTVAAPGGPPLISACLTWVREHKNMYDV
jgi:hypothetical protein